MTYLQERKILIDETLINILQLCINYDNTSPTPPQGQCCLPLHAKLYLTSFQQKKLIGHSPQ